MTSDVTSYVEKKHGVEDLKEGNGVSSLAEAVIPKVNGEKVAASEIYLPESSGESGILVSSLDVNKPDKVLDSKLVILDMPRLISAKMPCIYMRKIMMEQ